MNILEYAMAKKLAGGGGAPINNQDKTITQNGTYTADEGYTGLGIVNVNVAGAGAGGGDNITTLHVEKVTRTTYLGNNMYPDEEFIVLDVYPKTNGTVNITYGGLTKTITDNSGVEEPEPQSVFFGTFNGVMDDVETPASGLLTISGDYRRYGQGFYLDSKAEPCPCTCIGFILSPVNIEVVPAYGFSSVVQGTFYGSEGLTAIEELGFYNSNINCLRFPKSLKTIGDSSFAYCGNLLYVTLPENIESIGNKAFYSCSKINSVIFLGTPTSVASNAFSSCGNVRDIYVPWSEGEVVGAPWGATGAYGVETNIHYNHVAGV